MAVAHNDEDSVRFLIKLGINVNAPVKDFAARTPLNMAVERGEESITRMLLQV